MSGRRSSVSSGASAGAAGLGSAGRGSAALRLLPRRRSSDMPHATINSHADDDAATDRVPSEQLPAVLMILFLSISVRSPAGSS